MENGCIKETTLCRTCMVSTNEFISLFDAISIESKEECLNSILMICTSIKVTKNDLYSQNICQICLSKLTESYLFKKKCYQTQERLEQIYKDYSPKFLKETVSARNQNDEDFSLECEREPESAVYSVEKVSPDCDNQLNYQDYNDDVSPCVISLEDSNYENISKDEHGSEKLCCTECGKKFLLEVQLQKHIRSHFDTEKFKCSICCKEFTRATDVKRHMSIHTGAKPYSCTLCNNSFTQSGSLSIHMRKQHKKEGIRKVTQSSNKKCHLCSICGKSFSHSSGLTVHLRRHKGEKPYVCQICDKSFVSSSRLTAHQRIHTGERPFLCKFCGKCFSQSTVMKKHMRSHFSENSHKCSFCSKSFSTLYYLNIHKRKHTGERPLICSVCSKSFSDPKNLKEHKAIHSGEKPFLCVLCGKTFRRSHHLKTHMKVHSKSKLSIDSSLVENMNIQDIGQ